MTLQHLRSSTANKRPDPTAMADGQIALNTAAASPGLFYKDSAGNLVKAGPVHVGSTAPNVSPASGGTAGNSTGEAWLDTSGSNPLLKIWSGAAWQTVQPVASGTVVSTADTGSVTSTMIANGTIVDADVNASAAIAGTKISPNFGSQTITTTGVVSAAAGAAATPSITFTGDTNTGIYSPGADQLALSTNGTGRLFVDASGNVKVGSTDNSNAATQYITVGSVGVTDGGLQLWARTNGQSYVQFGDTTTSADQYRGYLQYSHASDFLALGTASQERLRITSAGLVGVGTSSVSANLDLVGSTSTSANNTITDAAFRVRSNLSGTENFAIRHRGASAGISGLNNTCQLIGSGTNAIELYTVDATPVVFGTSATERMRLDSSGRLGIGTSAPGSGNRLHIADTSKTSTDRTGIKLQTTDALAANTGLPLVWSGNIGNTSDYTWASITGRKENATSGDAAGYLQFATGSSGGAVEEKVRIDSAGRVGIGTSTPSRTLDCAGDIRSYANATEGSLILGSNNNAYIASNSAELRVWTRDTRPVAFIVNDNERARIDSSGRLLVGTSSARNNFYNTAAGAGLQVEGSGDLRRISVISSENGSAAPAALVLGLQRSGSVGGNTVVQNGDLTGVISFMGNDGSEFVEHARIVSEVDGTPGANDMPGRLVFSTTADGASSPTERMRISQDGAIGLYSSSTYGCLYSGVSSGAGTSVPTFVGRHSSTNTVNGTETFKVWSNGDVVNTNNSYAGISDIKLKENIVDASSQWSDIKALQVRNYNFKEGQTHTQIGLIAQEVELVSPGLVSESPDRDAEGSDLGTVTKSVNYSVLYMKAVKALQEAMERIETLEAKVAALESA